MKPYLVDVPVRVNIWIRPECQRKQFEVIKQARPSILFLISDGGRNEKEWEAIYQNRKMIEDGIDWECKVYKLYEDKNNGLYGMGAKGSALVWSTVDRCILLEDDILPSVSYFQYCAELLEKYKDDERISVICGMNHTGVSEDVTSDYFFSKEGSIWGIARWRRTVNPELFAYKEDPYVMKLLKQQTGYNKTFWKHIVGYSKDKYHDGHPAGAEFKYEFCSYGYNQLQIIPKRNMISNMGCDSSAAHATELKKMPRATRNLFNMKTYEMEFPMKHPKFVIADAEYEKKRNKILAYNMPLIAFFRRLETLLIIISQFDFKRIEKKIRNLLWGKNKVEK